MKKTILNTARSIVFLLLTSISTLVHGQTYNTCITDDVYLIADAPAGSAIQWQQSANGFTYSDVQGATQDTLALLNITNSFFYRARITGPSCNPYFSQSRAVNVNSFPTIADAGSDQVNQGNSTSLAANTPIVGQGNWSIIAGTGGVLGNPTSPTTTLTGTDTAYVLVWTISNAPCPSSSDTVVINLNIAPALPFIVCGVDTLYVHPTDNSGPVSWWNNTAQGSGGCQGIVVGASSFTDGQSNTALITAACASTSAAKLCEDLVAFGFSDWYLPARDELVCLRTNQATLGGFTAAQYWSSTEGSGILTSNAWAVNFASSATGASAKGNQNRVRCVRKN